MKKLNLLWVFALCSWLGSTAAATDTIVDTAVKAGNFSTLAAALEAAGLIDTLQGSGPFTVFAPTDEAFSKLPDGTVETLLKPENKSKLAAVLTFHVIPGKVLAEQVVKLNGATTVNGQRIDIKVADGGVLVDNAKVVSTDIDCSNGVIHVIDSVLLPVEKTIPQVAEDAGSFKTLLAAVGAADLAQVLSGDGPFTVFAPTDDAFAALPEGTVASLLKPENRAKLVEILKYHVVAGRVYAADVVGLKAAKTLAGSNIQISVSEKGVAINRANVVATDIDAVNGVIHVVDAVLLPPAPELDARQVIEHAVAEGAALYNSGHHSACAQLYRKTMNDLMSSTAGETYGHHMRSVIKAADAQHTAGSQAWTLRRGLDRMYSLMSK